MKSILIRAYKLLTRAAGALGYHLVLAKNKGHQTGYEPVFPHATYAPWLIDNAFNHAYQAVKGHTLVGKYRCYELWQLVEQTANLHGVLMEVGVWRGGTGALIAQKCILSGIKDKVYLCDTFVGVVKAGKEDSKYKGGEHADTSKNIVAELIHKLRLDNVEILEGIFPDETAHRVQNQQFRFCHIDVDVYQSAKDILDWVWSKLVVGGIVVFDDYGFRGCEGVTRLVNESWNKRDACMIHNLNGHGILIKTRGNVL